MAVLKIYTGRGVNLLRFIHQYRKIERFDSLTNLNIDKNPTKAISYADSALKYSRAINDSKHILKNAQLLGKLYQSQHQYIESINAFNLALKHSTEKNTYWENYHRLAKVYYFSGNFSQALELYFDVLKFYEEQKNFNQIAQIKSDIGVLFFRQENLYHSLNYYREAFESLEKAENPSLEIRARIETNIGLTYNNIGEFQKAEQHFLNSLEINKSIGDSHIRIVNIGNIAATYAEREQYETAQIYFSQAIKESEEKGDFMSAAINTGDLSVMLSLMSQLEKYKNQKEDLLHQSIEGFKKALDTIGKYHDLRRYQFFSHELAQAWKRKENYEESLKNYEIYTAYKDSLFSEEINRELVRLEIQNDFSKRIDSLQLENEKKIAVRDATLKAKQKQEGLMATALFLLVIIGILLFYQNQTKKKNNDNLRRLNNELASANQIKTRLFGILTHDLRSPISNIVKFLRLKKDAPQSLTLEMKNQLEIQTQHSAENLLSTMEEMLLWCKIQMELFHPHIETVSLESIFTEFRLYETNYPNVDFTFDIESNLNLETDKNYLKTIIRNLTSNAINATEEKENPKIKWKAFSQNGQVFLEITDNGIGANLNQFKILLEENYSKSTEIGFGLYLVKEMAGLINCSFKINSTIGKGTKISIRI